MHDQVARPLQEVVHPAPAGRGSHLVALDGWRGLSILCVLAGHMLPLGPAVIVSVLWGLFVIVVLSYFLAKSQGESPLFIIGEHLAIAVLVIVFSHYIGVWVAATFA